MVAMNQSPSSLDCFNMSTLLLENSGAIIFGLCLIVCILYCLVCARCRRDLVGLPPRITGRPAYAGGAVASNAGGDGGLSQLAIDALPSFAFRRGGDVDSCAVCLGLVAEGEMVRLLPDCGHTFHVECIDAWLHSHSMCPLCRKEAKTPPPPKEEEVELGRDRGGLSQPGLE